MNHKHIKNTNVKKIIVKINLNIHLVVIVLIVVHLKLVNIFKINNVLKNVIQICLQKLIQMYAKVNVQLASFTKYGRMIAQIIAYLNVINHCIL